MGIHSFNFVEKVVEGLFVHVGLEGRRRENVVTASVSQGSLIALSHFVYLVSDNHERQTAMWKGGAPRALSGRSAS